ncbi:SpoIIE family protein phosphatase [Thalassotalea sp. G2M2-11]|uniref:SpoIIE family protein phosphatase n=1 Tax=Thalassotalea sp. G2M2-11 TaxID=2787627 RepID=UPI001F494805|nr:SpoIIE family protein phosphatase [Thalassotalea sp. G2M2-11]
MMEKERRVSQVYTNLALVVDDSPMQCKVLSILLKEEGYRVLTANDGARAIALFVEHQPDLVLMDINMPVMNGFQAARQIKQLSKDNSLCPLIFVTSLDTEQAYVDSIEAGGDGILVRPFTPAVFKAKIKSIQRISDLYRQVKQLQQAQQKDAELAEQLMFSVIESRNYGLDRIGMIKDAAELFSGDIQLTALNPNGDLNVLLGDFTGHGLRASIGAIPLAEAFRAMTNKGFSLNEIVAQLNQQLYQLLPTDFFLAAAVVTISSQENAVYIFNAGLPDVYIFDCLGQIKNKIASFHPPLGILPNLLTDVSTHVQSINDSDRVILISDGIIEARNENGDIFGVARFEQAAHQGVQDSNVNYYVRSRVTEFCQGLPHEDDISLIDIPCGDWQSPLIVNTENQKHHKIPQLIDETDPLWHWQLSLRGQRLACVNPIPIAMSQINEIEGHSEHWQNLFTILTELFVNALDHGVLVLDSMMKSSDEGFSQYFSERETRLKHLTVGMIQIDIRYFKVPDGGMFVIKVKDSGEGFDFSTLDDVLNGAEKQSGGQKNKFSGRGMHLVAQLCEQIKYHDNGSLVEAWYHHCVDSMN